MKILPVILILGALLVAPALSTKEKVAKAIPDLKLSVEFGVIKSLKNIFVAPIVQNFLQNLTIPGPINIQRTVGLATLDVNASNIHVESLSVDWANTNLLAAPENRVQLMISNVSLIVSFDYDIKYIAELSKGRGTLSIKDLFASVVLEIKATEVESGFIVFVYDTKIWWDSITVALESLILNDVINEYLYVEKNSLQTEIDGMVNTQLNATLIGYTSKPLSLNFTVPKTTSSYNIRFAPTTTPSIPQYTVNGTSYSYLNMPLDILITNLKTNQTAKLKESDNMPDRAQNTSDIEIMVSNNLVNQIVWTAIDSGAIDLEISNNTLPKNSPLQLNTSQINILFPGIADTYGPNKGIYLKVRATSPLSHIYVRGGRVIGEISLGLKFIVDKDSSHYPQTVANCTTCEEALDLNATVLFAVHDFNIDESHFGVNVIDLKFYELNVISSKVFINLPLTSYLLNSIGGAMIPTINDQLKAGIANPIFGLFGINKMEFLLAVDYIYAGIGFIPLMHNATKTATA